MNGSGRAADLLAYTLSGNSLKREVMQRILETFPDVGGDTREAIYKKLKKCTDDHMDNVRVF